MLAVFVEIQFRFTLAVVAPGVRPSISGLKVPFEGVATNEDEDALDDEDATVAEDTPDDEDVPAAEDEDPLDDDEDVPAAEDEDAPEDEDVPVAEDEGVPEDEDVSVAEDSPDDEDVSVAEDKGPPDDDGVSSLELKVPPELLLGSSPLEEDRLLSIPTLDDDKIFKSISGDSPEQAENKTGNKTAAAMHKNARTLL